MTVSSSGHAQAERSEQPTALNAAQAPAGMVFIPAGEFLMGSDRHYPDEGPVHRVAVDGFFMDQHLVTNAEFRRFVEATGHVTFAEIAPDPADYPGALPQMLVPSSLVFVQPKGRVDMRNIGNWWMFMRGADWRHPYGPKSTLNGLDRHPVVHIAFSDAEAYTKWAGKELPTEAEWENSPCQ
jgi:sulfatase modifying factor 1